MAISTIEKASVIIPKLTGILSLLGSSAIIAELRNDGVRLFRNSATPCQGWRRRQQQPAEQQQRQHLSSTTNQRILLTLCVADIIFTIPNMLTSALVPVDMEGAWGNVRCVATRFLFQVGNWSTPLLNLMFTVVAMLTVCYQWPERRLEIVEPWLQGIVWIGAIIVATFPIPLGWYGWNTDFCWMFDAPAPYQLFITVFPMWPCIIACAMCFGVIYRHVRIIESRTHRFRVASVSRDFGHLAAASNNTASAAVAAPNSSVTFSIPSSQDHQRYESRSQVVAKRALWFVCSFLATYTSDLIFVVYYYSSTGRENNKLWILFNSSIYPMQGFFNFCSFASTSRRSPEEMTSFPGRWLYQLVISVVVSPTSSACGRVHHCLMKVWQLCSQTEEHTVSFGAKNDNEEGIHRQEERWEEGKEEEETDKPNCCKDDKSPSTVEIQAEENTAAANASGDKFAPKEFECKTEPVVV